MTPPAVGSPEAAHRRLGLRQPDEVPNPREATPNPQARPPHSDSPELPICRRFVPERRPRRLPENRGVPGATPGLAISTSCCNDRSSRRADGLQLAVRATEWREVPNEVPTATGRRSAALAPKMAWRLDRCAAVMRLCARSLASTRRSRRRNQLRGAVALPRSGRAPTAAPTLAARPKRASAARRATRSLVSRTRKWGAPATPGGIARSAWPSRTLASSRGSCHPGSSRAPVIECTWKSKGGFAAAAPPHTTTRAGVRGFGG
jgi:hypothetical protein